MHLSAYITLISTRRIVVRYTLCALFTVKSSVKRYYPSLALNDAVIDASSSTLSYMDDIVLVVAKVTSSTQT